MGCGFQSDTFDFCAASRGLRGWNSLDIIVDTDMVTTTLNGRRGGNSATNDRMMGYGPIALHAGGTGEVRSRDIAIKDRYNVWGP